MSFDRIFFCRFCPANFFAGAIASFSLVFVAKVLAQEAVGTAATSAPSSQPVAEMSAESSVPMLPPAADSNLHSSNDLRNEVSAEPRRFQYGFKVTVRGVYDDNINISQTNRVSDYYLTIEPVLTLGLGDIAGREDNYIRLDYAPSLFLFLDHSENDAVQHLIRVEGQHRFSRLTVTLAEEIAILDGTDLRSIADATAPGSHANLDVSGRTKFETYNTRLSAIYQPFDSSTVTLTGSRRTFNSGILAGQDFAATTIAAGLRQRLLHRFYFGVSGGYQNSDYFSTVQGVAANRQDNYYFVEPSLDFSITRFWTIGGYYLHRQNDSSFRAFSFDDNQVGFRTGLTF